MGCSASRPNTFITKSSYLEENPPNASPCCLDNPLFPSQYSSPALPKALSLHTPLVHHPPSRKGDSHHLVSLTSTTYGSLLLIDQSPRHSIKKQQATLAAEDNPGESLSPDSVINTWELMDGLDDDIDLKPRSSLSCDSFEFVTKPSPFQHLGSDWNVKKQQDSFDLVKSDEKQEKPVSSSKPLWRLLSEESFLSDMDPDVVSSYRRALSSRQLGYSKESRRRSVRSVDSSPILSASFPAKKGIFLHDKDDKIVLYFTSLRGIRKTYEDCCAVRMIFRGFRVPVDERDISMDSAYRKELQTLLKGKALSLPQVFIRGEHVGGVDDIRLLNENGELGRVLEGFPVRDPRLVCESCGDARFVPCPNCSGSRKVFDEEDEQLRRCLNCNENGLIRCSLCCC